MQGEKRNKPMADATVYRKQINILAQFQSLNPCKVLSDKTILTVQQGKQGHFLFRGKAKALQGIGRAVQSQALFTNNNYQH